MEEPEDEMSLFALHKKISAVEAIICGTGLATFYHIIRYIIRFFA